MEARIVPQRHTSLPPPISGSRLESCSAVAFTSSVYRESLFKAGVTGCHALNGVTSSAASIAQVTTWPSRPVEGLDISSICCLDQFFTVLNQASALLLHLYGYSCPCLTGPSGFSSFIAQGTPPAVQAAATGTTYITTVRSPSFSRSAVSIAKSGIVQPDLSLETRPSAISFYGTPDLSTYPFFVSAVICLHHLVRPLRLA
ncbi:hypothetical protein F4780DRAFT_664736 [Xylariomycetidae sp. FL0641]|nr:hypothetical protein F4780DRAFT_664736 [Xylariomycetidae sp. FL0641]